MEVPLCGHATLASSHVLTGELGVDAEQLRFETRRAGELRVRRDGEVYEMDFPADPPTQTEEPAGLAEALGVRPQEVWTAAYVVALVQDEATLRALTPDIAAVHRIGQQARGGRGNLVVAALADAGRPYQVVSRFFAPGSGVPEDPATGSAHCILAPLFAQKLGRPTLRYHQAYPGRGGDLECEVRGDRVMLRGRAVTVVESRLRV
jgi:PhzF family phenazine biosynthesis protein